MSNEFFEHQIDLADGQVKKLKKKASATIKYNQIGSGLTVHLSGNNHKKVMKSFNGKKNHRLKLSDEELMQNEKAGSGFFKTLHKMGVSRRQFNKGAKAVAKIAAPIVKDIAVPVGTAAGAALATAAGNPELAPIAGIVGAKLAQEGSNQLTKYAGKGIRKTRIMGGPNGLPPKRMPKVGGQHGLPQKKTDENFSTNRICVLEVRILVANQIQF